jgi:hypothetical protein
MFVGAKAAVFMVVIMFISGVSEGQRQQGKRQSEQQTTHGGSPESKVNKLLCNLIT